MFDRIEDAVAVIVCIGGVWRSVIVGVERFGVGHIGDTIAVIIRVKVIVDAIVVGIEWFRVLCVHDAVGIVVGVEYIRDAVAIRVNRIGQIREAIAVGVREGIDAADQDTLLDRIEGTVAVIIGVGGVWRTVVVGIKQHGVGNIQHTIAIIVGIEHIVNTIVVRVERFWVLRVRDAVCVVIGVGQVWDTVTIGVGAAIGACIVVVGIVALRDRDHFREIVLIVAALHTRLIAIGVTWCCSFGRVAVKAHIGRTTAREAELEKQFFCVRRKRNGGLCAIGCDTVKITGRLCRWRIHL